jgi:hypothetical protein
MVPRFLEGPQRDLRCRALQMLQRFVSPRCFDAPWLARYGLVKRLPRSTPMARNITATSQSWTAPPEAP